MVGEKVEFTKNNYNWHHGEIGETHGSQKAARRYIASSNLADATNYRSVNVRIVLRQSCKDNTLTVFLADI